MVAHWTFFGFRLMIATVIFSHYISHPSNLNILSTILQIVQPSVKGSKSNTIKIDTTTIITQIFTKKYSISSFFIF